MSKHDFQTFAEAKRIIRKHERMGITPHATAESRAREAHERGIAIWVRGRQKPPSNA